MAEKALPHFEHFHVHKEVGSASTCWTKWLQRFNNLMTAIRVDNMVRKRALLLHYVGVEVFDIFDTLPKAETGKAKDFEKTAALTKYFSLRKNIEFEVHIFCQASQKTGKTIDSYHTWLRQMAAMCEFHEDDQEIKSQIIQSCTSQRLRCRALRETMTLQQILDFGRSLEISERETTGMESKRQNTVHKEVKIVGNGQKQKGGKNPLEATRKTFSLTII